MIIDFTNSFIERPTTNPVSDEQIDRIAKAYKKAMSDERSRSPLYKVGNIWVPLYNAFMGDFVNSLLSDNREALRDNLENLFRRKFSNGLHGLHFEMYEKYMQPGVTISAEDVAIWVETVKAGVELQLLMMPEADFDSMDQPLIGNPYGIEINSKFYGGMSFYYFVRKVDLLLRKASPKIIEVGGGYGGFPHALKRKIPQAHYVNFDLPEVLAISSFYILSAYPAARIALFGEIDVGSMNPEEYDFIFLPNFEIENVRDNTFDLSYNTYSLSEMELEQSANYIKHLCRAASKYLFHVNHTLNFTKNRADSFPIDYEKFTLLHRAPAMWGKSNLREPWISEHEFIYLSKYLI